MFGSIGLALGALSTVSSLIDSAVSSVGQAAKDAPTQTFSAGPAPAAKASLAGAHLNPGPPIPKFDKHTHAHLLALQEQYAT
jgi:hypothetical protein